MATPMFRDLSRALEAPEEGRELWSGIPADEEPAYAEEMFRKASDAALARENALPKTGYVPAGVGPMVEPSMESPLAPLPSGLRSRKPVEFTPDTAKMQGKLAGVLGGNQLLRGPEYGRPLSDEEFASEQERARKLMAQDNASFARDIPVASAEGSKTLASTVPGSGGDDEMGRLSMGQALVRALEGSGSVISGQNLRSGAADTLGERMKQIEALRAKREDQTLEQQRERSTWGASNRATLASALAQWKGDPEKTTALEALASGADTTKPGDFSRNTVNAVMTKPKVLGAEAGAKKVEAGTDATKARTKTEDLLREPKVRKLGTAANLDEARRKALENQARADVVTSDKEARETKNDARAAEAAVTRAMERANKGGDVTTTANNFIALETVAPGFAKGQKPDWLGRFTLQKAMEFPAISNKAAALNSALENFTANIRKTLFGASLTGNEKASYDLIVNRKLTATPEQLAAAVNVLREGAARFAQNHFVTALKFHEKETSDVLRSSAVYGPALKQGGIYADVWKLPGAAAGETPAAGDAVAPPAGAVKKLKDNPAMKEAFDLKYGAGAAAKALGGE